ncbi:MAG: SusD/RagB family nutrient-binding outer membrane lipoprotein [Agriterribacter sp.]
MTSRIKNFITLGLAVILSQSCVKYSDFGDTNVNPSGVSEPVLSALLTNAEGTVGSYATTQRLEPGYFSQYFSETQYSSASLYSIPQIDFVGSYSGILNDLEIIITKNTSNNLTQVARILKVYIYWILTDRWGDVPYSQALQGAAAVTPVYDKQSDIYPALLTELKEAVAAFDATSVITGDVSNYNGDADQWKKLANSLRVLIALQMSKVYTGASDLAATELKAALADANGIIETNDDNFTLEYPGGNISSPWYNLYNGRKDVGESATMTALTSGFGDARQSAFASDANGDPTNVGVPYGWTRDKVDPWTQANPDWAYVLDASLRTQTGSVTIIPASTVLLARAEAADRGWTSEDALTLYQSGIAESFSQWGQTTPSSTYLNQSGVAFTAVTGTGANIKQIAIQRYLAGYPNGMEGWNIWRRTGYPVLTPAPDAVNSEAGYTIPRRFTYGQSEYLTNVTNVNAASALLSGGDKMDSRIWWDK